MKMHLYLYQLCLPLILYSSFITAKNFAFDFGGVLLHTNKFKSLQYLGPLNLAEYAVYQQINALNLNSHIQTVLFTTLDAIAHDHNLNEIHAEYHPAYDEHGTQLPLIMCTWLQGTMSSSEIRSLIDTTISNQPDLFKCPAEQRIFENTTSMIFTPEKFIDSRTVSTEGIAFIKGLKNEGHTIYGLSNWDKDSKNLLKEKYPEFIDLFDDILFSCDANANKPHRAIFDIFLERNNLDPKQCIYVDDQKENIKTAKDLGFEAFLFKSFKKLTQDTSELRKS